MKYVMRTMEGKEYGPVDLDVLVQWTENGRVTEECEVRNTLMKSWTKVRKVPFLGEALIKAKMQPVKPKETVPVGPRETFESLNRPGVFKYVPANPAQRLLAWLVDIVIVLGFGACLLAALHFGLASLPAELQAGWQAPAYFGSALLFAAFFIFYYTVGLGFAAQTIGQWFWGIMIVRAEGEPVYVCRAFFYAVFSALLMPTTMIFTVIMPKRRALQDLLTGVRIIKITVREL